MPSNFAPNLSMPARLCRLTKWVRNSTAMHRICSKAWVKSNSLHSVFSALRCTRLRYHVDPISRRRLSRSMFMYFFMPTASPLDFSMTVKGSIEPCFCSSSRRSISAAIRSGAGMDVYHKIHSSPSFTASTSCAQWVCESGVSDTCCPIKVTESAKPIIDPREFKVRSAFDKRPWSGKCIVPLRGDDLEVFFYVFDRRRIKRKSGLTPRTRAGDDVGLRQYLQMLGYRLSRQLCVLLQLRNGTGRPAAKLCDQGQARRIAQCRKHLCTKSSLGGQLVTRRVQHVVRCSAFVPSSHGRACEMLLGGAQREFYRNWTR